MLFIIVMILLCVTAAGSSSRVICKMSFHTSSRARKQDFYQILGVPRTATQKEIKKSYYQVILDYCVFVVLLWPGLVVTKMLYLSNYDLSQKYNYTNASSDACFLHISYLHFLLAITMVS